MLIPNASPAPADESTTHTAQPTMPSAEVASMTLSAQANDPEEAGARIATKPTTEICPIIADPNHPLPATPLKESIQMSDDLEDDDDDFDETDGDDLEDEELPDEREDDGLGTDEEDDLDEFDDFDEEDFDDDFDDDFEEEFEDDYEIEIEEDLSQMGIKTEDDEDEDDDLDKDD